MDRYHDKKSSGLLETFSMNSLSKWERKKNFVRGGRTQKREKERVLKAILNLTPPGSVESDDHVIHVEGPLEPEIVHQYNDTPRAKLPVKETEKRLKKKLKRLERKYEILQRKRDQQGRKAERFRKQNKHLIAKRVSERHFPRFPSCKKIPDGKKKKKKKHGWWPSCPGMKIANSWQGKRTPLAGKKSDRGEFGLHPSKTCTRTTWRTVTEILFYLTDNSQGTGHWTLQGTEKGRFVWVWKKTLNRDNYLHSHECSQLYLEVAQIKFWDHMRPKRSQFRALQLCVLYLLLIESLW